jgi:hypothetical protein
MRELWGACGGLLAKARLDQAEQLCATYPGQTASVATDVDAVRKMLKSSSVSDAEMRMVVEAMEREFSGTGHWYRCVNGHPFTIGELSLVANRREERASYCPHASKTQIR